MTDTYRECGPQISEGMSNLYDRKLDCDNENDLQQCTNLQICSDYRMHMNFLSIYDDMKMNVTAQY